MTLSNLGHGWYQGCGAGAALFEPEPPLRGGSGKLRKTNIIYSVLLNFANFANFVLLM